MMMMTMVMMMINGIWSAWLQSRYLIRRERAWSYQLCEQWIVCRWTGHTSDRGLTINSLLLNCSKTRKITFRSIIGNHDGRTGQIPRASREELLAWPTRRGRGRQNDSNCRPRRRPISALLTTTVCATADSQRQWKTLFRSTVLWKLLYGSIASMVGILLNSGRDIVRPEVILRRCQPLGYCSNDTPTLDEMFDDVDGQLFNLYVLRLDVNRPTRGHRFKIMLEHCTNNYRKNLYSV